MTAPLHLLVVDDDDVYWTLFDRALAQVDPEQTVHTHRLSDGDQVLPYLNRLLEDRNLPWPQLILLDERMPRMDGTQLLPQLRAHQQASAIPVCIMSSSDQPALIASCYRQGASFYIGKPLSYRDLRDKLTGLLSLWRGVVALPPPHPIG